MHGEQAEGGSGEQHRPGDEQAEMESFSEGVLGGLEHLFDSHCPRR